MNHSLVCAVWREKLRALGHNNIHCTRAQSSATNNGVWGCSPYIITLKDTDKSIYAEFSVSQNVLSASITCPRYLILPHFVQFTVSFIMFLLFCVYCLVVNEWVNQNDSNNFMAAVMLSNVLSDSTRDSTSGCHWSAV